MELLLLPVDCTRPVLGRYPMGNLCVAVSQQCGIARSSCVATATLQCDGCSIVVWWLFCCCVTVGTQYGQAKTASGCGCFRLLAFVCKFVDICQQVCRHLPATENLKSTEQYLKREVAISLEGSPNPAHTASAIGCNVMGTYSRMHLPLGIRCRMIALSAPHCNIARRSFLADVGQLAFADCLVAFFL